MRGNETVSDIKFVSDFKDCELPTTAGSGAESLLQFVTSIEMGGGEAAASDAGSGV